MIWQIVTQIRADASREGVDPEALVNRLVYGVGTQLITSTGAPALGGVYKLVALNEDGSWKPAIKVSDSPEKIPNPGHKRAWRLYDRRGRATADLLALADEDPGAMDPLVLRHPSDMAKVRVENPANLTWEELHRVILDDGRLVYEWPSLQDMRVTRRADVERLDTGVRRLINPHIYHVSLSERLWQLKAEVLAEARGARG